MPDPIIRVENLGKMYRIGAREEQPESFREALGSLLGSPFHYLRQMRRPPSEEETLWALKDVSFEVKPGEVVGIPSIALRTGIGRNGAGTLAPARSAGESTLLKILSRITEPTSGHAETCPAPRGCYAKRSEGCWQWVMIGNG